MADIPVDPLVLDEATAIANTYIEQSNIDAIDWLIVQLGVAGWGVITGCQVTAQLTPDLTVQVAPGLIQAGAQQIHVPGGTSAAFPVNATNPRYALVEIHATGGNFDGTIVRNSGTPAASPATIFPAPTVGNVVLAALTIPANATSITTAQIVDKRMLINNAFSTGSKLYLSSFDSTTRMP